MKIYTAGSNDKKFLDRNYTTESFFVNEKHDKENIDNLNPWYCEITALYYLQKHCDDDIMGLDQYRKAFILTDNQISEILKDNDIIIHSTNIEPKTRLWWLDKWGYTSCCQKMYAVIKYLYPDCAEHYMNALQAYKSCQHNMFICNRKTFNLYCNWLFSILDLFSSSFDLKQMPLRSLALVIELTCLNTFIEYHKLKVYDAPVKIGNK